MFSMLKAHLPLAFMIRETTVDKRPLVQLRLKLFQDLGRVLPYMRDIHDCAAPNGMGF